MKPRIVAICGTRPDAIKTAPVVLELRKYPEVECILVSTGQHREMLAQALSAFGLAPDYDLDIMVHGQTLAQVTTRALEGIDSLLEKLKPQWVLAQGDTTTTFVASLAAFYRQVPVGHIEAGLRTDRIDRPFPEEFNRRAAALVSRLHFAPTSRAAENLIREGMSAASTFVTGNTGIDALHHVAAISEAEWFPEHKGRVVLLTTHRRENWGESQKGIASAVRQLVDDFSDVLLVVPMHRNPIVREALEPILGSHDRIKVIEPPDYMDFVKLMQRSTLILTDSGGVQEEAPTFGVPVLVLRNTTERPEGVHAGVAKLVGTEPTVVLNESRILLTDDDAYKAMAQARSPYGDARACERIRFILLRELGVESPEVPMWT